jgi:hypothetical protein
MSATKLDPVRLARVRELATASHEALKGWWFPANALKREGFIEPNAELIAACDPAFMLSLIEAAEGLQAVESGQKYPASDV